MREVVQLVRDLIAMLVAFFKIKNGRSALAQDALGQDPARHHAEDRRRPRPWKCWATIEDLAALDEDHRGLEVSAACAAGL